MGDSHLRAAVSHSDLLLPNEAEALRLSGEPGLAAAAAALTAGGTTLAVKLGARGALCVTGQDRQHVALPPVIPVDTTGAGDCFNAGLAAGLLDGLPLSRAVALGCAAGALSTRAPGGTASCPDLAEARALARQAVIQPAGVSRPGYEPPPRFTTTPTSP